jgi:hypothetical protein
MSNSNPNGKGKDIWSLITVEQLAAAIASLGDRIDQLQHETWRLNDETRLPNSLWGEVIGKLKIDHNEKMRKSLHKIWYLGRRDIKKLVKKEVKIIKTHKNDRDDGDVDGTEEVSVTERNNSNLIPDLSLPLPQRPNTRAVKAKNINNNDNQSSTIHEISFVLTPSEWKAAFSRTHQKMKDDWTDLFYEKLTSSGIKCPVSFRKANIKKGKRKQACQFFWCRAMCTITICPRSYHIFLKNEPDVNTSALFLVRISREENHDMNIETSARQLRGKNRLLVGKKLYYLFSKIILL